MLFPKVTFTMTSGRRIDLFRRTMRSFLANCLDKDLIASWVVCDDRSSAEDIAAMKRENPMLQVAQSPRPGQAASLNYLYHDCGLIPTDFVVHWEDDWEMIRCGHFIREALDIALSDDRIRNVVFRKWAGVYVRSLDSRYTLHVFREELLRGPSELFGRLTRIADATYPGYSWNPSLHHLPTIQSLGRCDEGIGTRYFDRPLAAAYLKQGLFRSNTWETYVEHIGNGRSTYTA